MSCTDRHVLCRCIPGLKCQELLDRYRRALKEHPACPAEVRLGIAACNFRLGSFKRAMAGYQRVLQLDPDCCEALLGMAVLSFNAPDTDRQAHLSNKVYFTAE